MLPRCALWISEEKWLFLLTHGKSCAYSCEDYFPTYGLFVCIYDK